MKLCRYGPKGTEKPALIDAGGRLRDLSSVVPDVTADALARIAAVDPDGLPIVPGEQRFGVPIAGTRTFVAIGLNYADHAAEANQPLPAEPIVFNKWISCLSGANDTVTIPRDSHKTDWEVELGVVIGTRARYVDEADALSHVAGYTVVNDLSERTWQQERGPTWDKGKGFPGFGPVGPWLVTPDEVGDPQDLTMWLTVNGARVQHGSTRTMIFTVAQIIAYCSQFMVLEPGDIVTTGTPPGVGLGQKPDPWFLKPGDVVELGIDRLGQQRQQFVAWSDGS